MPTRDLKVYQSTITVLEENDKSVAMTIVDLAIKTGIATSKSDAKRLIQAGGLYLNEEKVLENREISTDDIVQKCYLSLRKGKGFRVIIKYTNIEVSET